MLTIGFLPRIALMRPKLNKSSTRKCVLSNRSQEKMVVERHMHKKTVCTKLFTSWLIINRERLGWQHTRSDVSPMSLSAASKNAGSGLPTHTVRQSVANCSTQRPTVSRTTLWCLICFASAIEQTILESQKQKPSTYQAYEQIHSRVRSNISVLGNTFTAEWSYNFYSLALCPHRAHSDALVPAVPWRRRPHQAEAGHFPCNISCSTECKRHICTCKHTCRLYPGLTSAIWS